MLKDSLGDRMKEAENATRFNLVHKVPVIGRLDGKAFHTFTRGLIRPYDPRMHRCMWAAAVELCRTVQGCQMAYVQSDEISLLLTDDATPNTDAWFGYDLRKMCSVAASTATRAFIRAMAQELPERFSEFQFPDFDARFWNLTSAEVPNYFIWRQQDASRNSINSLGQFYFSHKELQGKTIGQVQDMLMLQMGDEQRPVNWNDCPTVQKRGVCVVKEEYVASTGPIFGSVVTRSRWVVDEDIPVFTQDRTYITRWLTSTQPNTEETSWR